MAFWNIQWLFLNWHLIWLWMTFKVKFYFMNNVRKFNKNLLINIQYTCKREYSKITKLCIYRVLMRSRWTRILWKRKKDAWAILDKWAKKINPLQFSNIYLPSYLTIFGKLNNLNVSIYSWPINFHLYFPLKK